MRKTILLLIVAIACCICRAQLTMENVLRTSPDGKIVDYMKQNDWLDCIDYHEAGMLDHGANNAFNSKVLLSHLDSHYAKVKISDNLTMQLGLVADDAQTDSTYYICMVKTFAIDSCRYSRLEMFDNTWKKLDTKEYVDIPAWESLFCRPDTMSLHDYEEALLLPTTHLYLIEMENNGNTLTFQPANTTLNAEERKRINDILVKINVKWAVKKRKYI